jgi:hypothetical protein
VAPTASVTVIVSRYVAAGTVDETFITTCVVFGALTVIPEFEGVPTIVTVLGAVPPVTVNVSNPAVPAGTPNVEVAPSAKLRAGLTLIVFTRVAADPLVSVAVIVAVYVSEVTELETFRRANPDEAVEVSRVIPALDGETEVSTKVFAPVPFAAVIVSNLCIPAVVRSAVVVSPRIVVAGLIVTVITETVDEPRLSVAVIVSK